MATPTTKTFEVWLTDKLTSVSADIDTDVFVSYIISILDEDGDEEDTHESISGLLAGVIDENLASDTTKAIVLHWNETKDERSPDIVEEDIGDKLSEMLGNQTLATVKEKVLTKEEAERKAAILAQYAQISDGEESDEEEVQKTHAPDEHHQPSGLQHHHLIATGAVGGGAGGDGVPTTKPAKQKVEVVDPLQITNSNKDAVAKVEQEKREKAKEDSEKKKEKDKQDRLAQKQKQQERKDQEKKRTQKGEKRR